MPFTFTNSLSESAASLFCSNHDKFYSSLLMPSVTENEVLFLPDGFQYIALSELVVTGEVVLGTDSEIVIF